ncbi:uncharacterized protein LOC131954186 [Physella acuta]|uniref:uncharacterized protein LOC131954186 n=1 Tax=Physella acuta TaxID=109671 RepID=UPI0027DC630A|nr:uncharacterized protein LOC131954186 [Physella acuta]XP_059173706.1 uncharacterized protein LOC131954186 [Physella acuta]
MKPQILLALLLVVVLVHVDAIWWKGQKKTPKNGSNVRTTATSRAITPRPNQRLTTRNKYTKSLATNPKPTTRNLATKPKPTTRNLVKNPKPTTRNLATNPKPTTRNLATNPKPTTRNLATKPKPTTRNLVTNPKPTTRNLATKPKPTTRNLVTNPKPTTRNLATNPKPTTRNLATNPKPTTRNLATNPKPTTRNLATTTRSPTKSPPQVFTTTRPKCVTEKKKSKVPLGFLQQMQLQECSANLAACLLSHGINRTNHSQENETVYCQDMSKGIECAVRACLVNPYLAESVEELISSEMKKQQHPCKNLDEKIKEEINNNICDTTADTTDSVEVTQPSEATQPSVETQPSNTILPP